MINKPIIVSVHMITYNHENYVSKAIESVLMQKANFPYEIVIGEDCSTDDTREIVFDYQKKYPAIIRVITSEKNVGPHKNDIRTLKNCTGKYVAFCEGDDYWTDPYKLQKQVDFLENHTDYGMVHSDIDLFLLKRKKIIKNIQNKIFDSIPTGNIFEDFLLTSFINTCTVCLRSGLLKNTDIKKVLNENRWIQGDRVLWLEIAHLTKIGYINESLATYRVLEESQVHSKDIHYQLNRFKQSYAIRFYFVKKYGCSETTKKKIKFQYNQGLLEFSFLMKDKILANSAYLSLIKNKTHGKHVHLINNRKITFKDKFHYLGSKKNLDIILRSVYFGQLHFKLGVEFIINRIKFQKLFCIFKNRNKNL